LASGFGPFGRDHWRALIEKGKYEGTPLTGIDLAQGRGRGA
jgi:hypothetical protein